MDSYQPKKLSTLRLLAFMLRALAQIITVWPLLLIAAFFLFPNSWHVRVQYSYEQRGNLEVMRECTYLGTRGFYTIRNHGGCPLITKLNRR